MAKRKNKFFMEATECHICEKPLEDDVNGRMDHLTNIQHWLEILNLDLRKIPIEKEMEKAMDRDDAVDPRCCRNLEPSTLKNKIK